jgi:sugar phosphate isomerase/epimerase
MTRRNFVRLGAGAIVAGAEAGRLAAKPLKLPIGLQLYSVRELLPRDFDGTLVQLREAGYTEVEAAGYYGRTAAQFRQAMERAGLRCVSTHYTLELLLAHPDELIEYGRELELEYIICPWPRRRDPLLTGALRLDDWRWVAGELNRIGEKVRAAGMVFGYHNHGPEFGAEGGVVFYDELLRLTDPKLVCFELDCGWAGSTGRNPAEYLAKTPERFPLLHVKDMAKGANGQFHSTVLGRGVVDYRPILRAATGLKHSFIEQEEFDIDVMEALRLDAESMRKLEV